MNYEKIGTWARNIEIAKDNIDRLSKLGNKVAETKGSIVVQVNMVPSFDGKTFHFTSTKTSLCEEIKDEWALDYIGRNIRFWTDYKRHYQSLMQTTLKGDTDDESTNGTR